MYEFIQLFADLQLTLVEHTGLERNIGSWGLVSALPLFFHLHQEALQVIFVFCHQDGIICGTLWPRVAYLWLLIFLPAILIPVCESSSQAFSMIYVENQRKGELKPNKIQWGPPGLKTHTHTHTPLVSISYLQKKALASQIFPEFHRADSSRH